VGYDGVARVDNAYSSFLLTTFVQKSKAYARKDETWVSTDQSFLRMAKFN